MRQRIETALHPVMSSGAMSIIKLIVLIHHPEIRIQHVISHINNTKFWELRNPLTRETEYKTLRDPNNFGSTNPASVRNNQVVDEAMRIALARILMSCTNSMTGQQLISEHGLALANSLVDPRISDAMVATLEFEYLRSVLGWTRSAGPSSVLGVRGGPPDTRTTRDIIASMDEDSTHPSLAIAKRPPPEAINSAYKRARRGDDHCLYPIRLSRNVQETNALVLPPGDFGPVKPFCPIKHYQDWKDNPSKSAQWQKGLQMCLTNHIEVELKHVCNPLLWDHAFKQRREREILPDMSMARGHLVTHFDSWNHHRASVPAMFLHFERNKMEPRPLEHLHYCKWADNLHYRDKVHALDAQLHGQGDGRNIKYDYHQPQAAYQANQGDNPPRETSHAFAENVAEDYYEHERRTLFEGPLGPSERTNAERRARLPLHHHFRLRYQAVQHGRANLYARANMQMETPHLSTELEDVETESNQSVKDVTPCSTHWSNNRGLYPLTPQQWTAQSFPYHYVKHGPP